MSFPSEPTLADKLAEKLHARGIVMVSGEIDDQLSTRVVAELLTLDADRPGREITMVLNSPGGSVQAMSAVYDTMVHLGSDIRTRCTGRADTVAAVLLAAGTPGLRQIARTATVTLEQPRFDEVHGSATDLRIAAAEAERRRATVEQILARHTGRPVEQVHQDIDRPLVLTADESVHYGLADAVS